MSKLVLRVTNIFIIGAFLMLVSTLILQFLVAPTFETDPSEDLEGVIKKSALKSYSNLYFDLEYYFIYREGEVLMDGYVLSPKHMELEFDYTKSTKADFKEVRSVGGMTFIPKTSGKVYFPIDERDFNNFFYLGVALRIITALFIIVQLLWIRKLIKNFCKGDFFNQLNHRVFTKLGLLYIAAGILSVLFKVVFYNRLLTKTIEFSEIQSSTTFNWLCVFVGMILLVVAQAFKQGIKIQEEQELTI